MTQTERILQYMSDFGSITQLDAIRDLGVMRLASRICDIEKQGIHVNRHMETSKNRYGEKTSYMRYYLEADHEM